MVDNDEGEGGEQENKKIKILTIQLNSSLMEGKRELGEIRNLFGKFLKLKQRSVKEVFNYEIFFLCMKCSIYGIFYLCMKCSIY